MNFDFFEYMPYGTIIDNIFTLVAEALETGYEDSFSGLFDPAVYVSEFDEEDSGCDNIAFHDQVEHYMFRVLADVFKKHGYRIACKEIFLDEELCETFNDSQWNKVTIPKEDVMKSLLTSQEVVRKGEKAVEYYKEEMRIITDLLYDQDIAPYVTNVFNTKQILFSDALKDFLRHKKDEEKINEVLSLLGGLQEQFYFEEMTEKKRFTRTDDHFSLVFVPINGEYYSYDLGMYFVDVIAVNKLLEKIDNVIKAGLPSTH